MALPFSDNFRQENWVQMSREDKLTALLDYESELAAMEGREPCSSIGIIPEDNRKMQGDQALLRGQYHDGEILLDQSLLDSETPYQAMETYFHEAQHAYQDYAIKNPGFHENESEVAEWQINQDAYIESGGLNDQSMYRFQPLESNANDVARERTDELFEGMYQDNSKYLDYQSEKEYEELLDRTIAERAHGSNYEEKASLEVHQRWHQQLEQEQNLRIENPQNPDLDLDEGEDYDYGYTM